MKATESEPSKYWVGPYAQRGRGKRPFLSSDESHFEDSRLEPCIAACVGKHGGLLEEGTNVCCKKEKSDMVEGWDGKRLIVALRRKKKEE